MGLLSHAIASRQLEKSIKRPVRNAMVVTWKVVLRKAPVKGHERGATYQPAARGDSTR